jgi:hypothetical protein
MLARFDYLLLFLLSGNSPPTNTPKSRCIRLLIPFSMLSAYSGILLSGGLCNHSKSPYELFALIGCLFIHSLQSLFAWLRSRSGYSFHWLACMQVVCKPVPTIFPRISLSLSSSSEPLRVDVSHVLARYKGFDASQLLGFIHLLDMNHIAHFSILRHKNAY